MQTANNTQHTCITSVLTSHEVQDIQRDKHRDTDHNTRVCLHPSIFDSNLDAHNPHQLFAENVKKNRRKVMTEILK